MALVLGLTACAPGDASVSHPPAASPTVAPLPDLSAARRELAELRSEARPHGPSDYRRDAFGAAWSDLDGNGCNQRDDVLLRDAQPGTARTQRQGRCDHDVLAGTWVDPYTGRTLVLDDLKDLHQAQAVQIDHVVPLEEAWVSGARSWRATRRHRFANVLRELLAVDGPTNASKGAGDPAAWRPRQGYQCDYAKRWIAVKHRWRLAADPSEVAALTDMLRLCQG